MLPTLLQLLPIALTVMHELPTVYWLGPLNVALEISRSFAPYVAGYALLSAIICGVQAARLRNISRLLRCVTLLLAALWLIRPLTPFLLPTHHTTSGGEVVSLLYANVYGPNNRYADLKQIITEEDPDFILLLEAHEGWKNGLSLAAQYPHRIEVTNRTRDGKLLYSKHPIVRRAVHRSRDARSTVIEAQTQLPSLSTITLFLAHAPSPISTERLLWREEFLRWAVSLSESSTDPTIFALDMNSSPFTTDYRNFARTFGGSNAFWGWGYQPTWRPVAHFPLQTMIDHVWLRGAATVLDARVLDAFGSDHLPIMLHTAINVRR